MTMHRSEAELHDYADGLLPPGEAAACEAHLAACAECAGFVARIASLKAALSAMPRLAEPARDLWPEVAAETVDAPPPGVIRFPAATAPFRRRSAPSTAFQRAAAAVLLFVGGVGLGRAGSVPADAPPTTVVAAEAPPADAMEAAARVQRAGTEYVAAVAAFAALADSAGDAERAQGHAVALAAMYGAAAELSRVAARDSSAFAVYRAVSGTRHPVARDTLLPGEIRF